MKKVILFDLDETLVDSREHLVDSIRRTLAARGHNFTNDHIRANMKYGSWREFRDAIGVTEEEFYNGEESVYKHRQSIADSIEQGFIKELSGASETLHAAEAAGYLIGIVTSGDEYETREKLQFLGFDWEEIQEKRSHIHTVASTEKGGLHKPDPEPALRALSALGIDGPHDVHIHFFGNDIADVGCAVNLRKLGYAVTMVLMNHYDDEYLKTVEGYDAAITSWEEGKRLLDL